MSKFGCFIYFNKKTGSIELITNERQGRKKNFIEVDSEFYSKLTSEEYNPSNYSVGYLTKPDGSVELSIIKRERTETYVFRNTQFEVVISPPVANTELIISRKKTKWEFELSDNAKLRIGNSLDQGLLAFFVILESDFDFLIRTILIEPFELRTKKRIAIPYETELEKDFKKVSIATKLTLQSYGIKVYE